MLSGPELVSRIRALDEKCRKSGGGGCKGGKCLESLAGECFSTTKASQDLRNRLRARDRDHPLLALFQPPELTDAQRQALEEDVQRRDERCRTARGDCRKPYCLPRGAGCRSFSKVAEERRGLLGGEQGGTGGRPGRAVVEGVRRLTRKTPAAAGGRAPRRGRPGAARGEAEEPAEEPAEDERRARKQRPGAPAARGSGSSRPSSRPSARGSTLRAVPGLREAKAEVKAEGAFVPAQRALASGPRPSAPPPHSEQREELLAELDQARRILEAYGDETSDEDVSDDELDVSDDELQEMVTARQRANKSAGRPPGGFLQIRDQILDERRRQLQDERRQASRDARAAARQDYEDALETWTAFDEGRFAQPVEAPADGPPLPPGPYERMSAEERRALEAAGLSAAEIEEEELRGLRRYLQAAGDFTDEAGRRTPTARRTAPPPARPGSPSARGSSLRGPSPRASPGVPFDRPYGSFNIEDFE